MNSNFINKNDPWEYNLDIDDSDLHLTHVLRSSSSTRVEPYPSTPNPVRIIPGPAGIVQFFSSTRVEPSPSTPNPVRIIPGSAGIVQQAKLLKERYILLGWDGGVMSTQEYMQKVVDDVDEDDDFKSGPWISATEYVNVNGGTSCSPNGYGDLTVTMKDLSGAAMILANVSVFSPKPSMHYLNITRKNVVKVFCKDTVPESGSGAMAPTSQALLHLEKTTKSNTESSSLLVYKNEDNEDDNKLLKKLEAAKLKAYQPPTTKPIIAPAPPSQ
ncbi:zf-CCHC domain-containing protein, partial [Tanacetum coccineum]